MSGLVIPNSIIHIGGNVFSRSYCYSSGSKPNDSNYWKFTVDFETKENRVLIIEKGNFNNNNTNIRKPLLANNINGVGFPFNSYVVAEIDSDFHEDMTSFDSLTGDILLVNLNNTVLWKR